jgi:type IV pilus assembly protein PilQ
VEIIPRAAGAKQRAVGAPSTGSAPARAYSGRPVTFNFQDVPVRTVLQLIAEESGLNVVAADTVQGNVTLRLVNVPWDQALDIVLQAKGLDKRRSGNVVWIAPQAEIAKYEQDREDARIALDNRVDLVTEYIQINYHNAGAIYKALTEAKGIGLGGGQWRCGAKNQNDNGFLSHVVVRLRMTAPRR